MRRSVRHGRPPRLRRLRPDLHGPGVGVEGLAGVPHVHLGVLPRKRVTPRVQHDGVRANGVIAGAAAGHRAVHVHPRALHAAGVELPRRAGVHRRNAGLPVDARVRHRVQRCHLRRHRRRHPPLVGGAKIDIRVLHRAVAVLPSLAADLPAGVDAFGVVRRPPLRPPRGTDVRARPPQPAATETIDDDVDRATRVGGAGGEARRVHRRGVQRRRRAGSGEAGLAADAHLRVSRRRRRR